ncbi:hypothetical protein AVEN_43285-1 [Araneus ventricosus]|uniref:Uncharacterized protein n=1 Tax=Araneus ventricosus TaxID=182803 RepID=A0A4Y2GCW6_ARAVE|nr:hypothetical protein AVEN_43285-1 [Araneus ventricosus]
MQKYDAQVADISLYLAMFERQARTAENEESEWVSQLMALLLLDLDQIILKDPEDKMKNYFHIKGFLLERFKLKQEKLRVKFTQHQRKSGAHSLINDNPMAITD